MSEFSRVLNSIKFFTILIIFLTFKSIFSQLQVIPELVHLDYFSTKYVADARLWLQRYRRREETYLNIMWTQKHLWANNVTIHIYFYENLHNQYKPSFVEMSWKLCELLNKDQVVGDIIRKTMSNFVCPIPPGTYNLANMSLAVPNFISVFPFERGKLTVNVTMTKTKELIASGHGVGRFESMQKNKKKNQ